MELTAINAALYRIRADRARHQRHLSEWRDGSELTLRAITGVNQRRANLDSVLCAGRGVGELPTLLMIKRQRQSDGGKLIMDTYTEDFGSADDEYDDPTEVGYALCLLARI